MRRERARLFLCAARRRRSIWSRRRYGRAHVAAGDEVLITAMEHHSNIVPWQMLVRGKGRAVAGGADQRQRRAASGRVRKAARAADEDRRRHARVERAGHDKSGAQMVEMAHLRGVPVLVDGAQAVPHMRWTCRRWIAISTSSPGTRSTDRPASACCTASALCWMRCRHTRAAAT